MQKNSIPLLKFYKRKYGDVLLVDILDLDQIKPGIRRLPVHRESFYCLVFVTGGDRELVSVNGHRLIVAPGNVICSIPGEVWEWNPDTHLRGVAIIFEEEFLLSFFSDLHFLSRFHYLRPDRTSPFLIPEEALWGRLMQQIDSMKQEMEVSVIKDAHILRAFLYGTLILLDRAECLAEDSTSTDDRTGNRYINRFVKLVNEHCHSEHGVEFYAGKLCITANYLNKIVREVYGVTAKAYVQQKLYEEAKRLLEYTFLNVAEIAEELNFGTSSYFIRFFKKWSGITPMQYRGNCTSPQK